MFRAANKTTHFVVGIGLAEHGTAGSPNEAGGYVTRQQSTINQPPSLAVTPDTPAVAALRKVLRFDDTVVRQRHPDINANSLT